MVTGYIRLIVRYAAYAIVIAVFAICWHIENDNVKLASRNRALLATEHQLLESANRPIIIKGLSLSLLAQLKTLERHTNGGKCPSKQLVLIYRDGCTVCEQQAFSWKALVSDRRLNDIETWLVSVGDSHGEMHAVVDALRRRKAPYRICRVTNIDLFIVRTGIRVVPETLVMRREGTDSVVEFVQQGLADKPRLSLLLDALTQELTARGAQIEPDAELDPL